MRLDHLAYACGPEGLASTVGRLETELGVRLDRGGRHPRSGTTNAIAPAENGIYLEVVAVLDHPAADKVPFGRAVKQRTAMGGGWLGWVVAVDDLAPIEARIGRKAMAGRRVTPDGRELGWQQIGVRDMIANPLLPFFIQWTSDPADHPAAPDSVRDEPVEEPRSDDGAPKLLRLLELELAGDPTELASWLDDPRLEPLDDVHVSWVAGPPGIIAAQFDTPLGVVRLT